MTDDVRRRRAAVRRGADAERAAAKKVGTRRVHRLRGERAPDIVPVRTAAGETLGFEVKRRKRLPASVVAALEQAAAYYRFRATPVAILTEDGGRSLAILDLSDLARLLGIAPPSPPPRRRRTSERQLSLL